MYKRIISFTLIVCFFLTSLGPLPKAYATLETPFMTSLPIPGTMINLSPAYEPVIIKGLTIHKDNPFLFDFIVDIGQDRVSGEPLKKEGEKLIKYFLASLAIPDKDVWVNLSPYEKNKIIPDALGQTDMGRDLLEQDYILKQITASLIYPEKQLGRTFWDKVYAKAQKEYGTTQIPVNTFNKVWIMADRAEVFEHNQTAFVVDQHLKVMLEEDYLSLTKHQSRLPTPQLLNTRASQGNTRPTNALASQIIKQIILPELEKEVNQGKNFAPLRQIFNSVILSTWYKKNLKEALLNQVYADRAKVKGINLNDSTIKEQIYQQYLKAFKKGVFNYIKEDINTISGQTIPRKYFSGGISRLAVNDLAMTADPEVLTRALPSQVSERLRDFATLATTRQVNDAAMMSSQPYETSMVQARDNVYAQVQEIRSAMWPRFVNDTGEIIASALFVAQGLTAQEAVALVRTIVDSLPPDARYRGEYSLAAAMFMLGQGLKEEKAIAQANRINERMPVSYRGGIRGKAIIAAALLMGQGLQEEEAIAQAIRIVDIATDSKGSGHSDDGGAILATALFMGQGLKAKKAFAQADSIRRYFNYQGGLVVATAALMGQGLTVEKAKEEVGIKGHRHFPEEESTIALAFLAAQKEIIGKIRIDPKYPAVLKARSKVTDKAMTTSQKIISKMLQPLNNTKVVNRITLLGFIGIASLVYSYWSGDNHSIAQLTFSLRAIETETNSVQRAVDLKKLAQDCRDLLESKGAILTPKQKAVIDSILNEATTNQSPQIKIYNLDHYSINALSSSTNTMNTDAAMISSQEKKIISGIVYMGVGAGVFGLMGSNGLHLNNDPWGRFGLVLATAVIGGTGFMKTLFGIVGRSRIAMGIDYRKFLYHYFTSGQSEEAKEKNSRRKLILSTAQYLRDQKHEEEIVHYFFGERVRLENRNEAKSAVWDLLKNASEGNISDAQLDAIITQSIDLVLEKSDTTTVMKKVEFTVLCAVMGLFFSAETLNDQAAARSSTTGTNLPAKTSGNNLNTFAWGNVHIEGIKISEIERKNEHYYYFSVEATSKISFEEVISRLAKAGIRAVFQGPVNIGEDLVSGQKYHVFGDPIAEDQAALADLRKVPGGIDLNTSSGMQWKVSKDGKGVEMNVDAALIARVRREGIDSLSPVIFRITPIASIWPLVGLQAPVK